MKSESIVLAVAGICFGVILGWVLSSVEAERTAAERAAAQPARAASAQQGQSGATGTGTTERPPLDEARVQALTAILKNDPKNAGAAVQLGTVYLEADRVEDAAKWYEQAIKIEPRNTEALAQLGFAYFVTKGPDQALQQLDQSLKIDPNHPRSLLNKGIVLWRGKQDLKAAADTWEHLVKVAPNTPEAQMAQQGLQAIGAGHQGGGTQPAVGQ